MTESVSPSVDSVTSQSPEDVLAPTGTSNSVLSTSNTGDISQCTSDTANMSMVDHGSDLSAVDSLPEKSSSNETQILPFSEATQESNQAELLSSGQLQTQLLQSAMDTIETYLADKRSVQMKRELSFGVFQVLDNLCSSYEGAKKKWTRILHDILLANEMRNLCLLYRILGEIFRALPGGIDPHLANSLLILHSLLSMWTHDNEEFSVSIVEKRLLMEHIDQLCMLKSSSMNPEVARVLVGLNLSIIYNCCQVPSIRRYFLSPEFDCVPIFKPFVTSPYLEVCLHAKFVLSYLSALLSAKEVDELLLLTFEEQDSFLEALQVGTSTNNRQVDCKTCSFSVSEALRTLKNLAANLGNCEMLIKSDIIPSLAASLISGVISEQKAGCELIWKLLRAPTVGPKFREKIQSSEISIEDCISPLLLYDDEELIMLADCVLFSMVAAENEEDSSRCLKYAEACHTFAHYSECLSLCERLLKQLSSKEDINRTKYLMGKASFYVYREKKFQLKKQSQAELQHTQEYQELHKECYQIARSTIGLLGTALDNGFLHPEGLKMLDIAMLDYITNAKSNCGRCLLCHQKQKLRKSHFFPKALLETFSKGASRPLDHKIFRFRDDYYGPSKSAKELYYEMFCSRCENLLSKHGETQFLPQFFSKIYDPSNPKQASAPLDIEYGGWLYQFCIGLIFRGLAMISCDIYINSDNVYNLLNKCRRFLCHINPQNLPHAKSGLSEVAILVNPSEVEEDPHLNLSRVLTSEILNYMCIQSDLDDDVISRPHQLHAFVIQFGMVNVLVAIETDELNVSKEYLINPSGGIFPVPADKERRAKLPKGLWKAYQIRAIDNYTDLIQIPDKVAREFESKKIQQPSELHQVFFPSRERAAEVELTRVMPSSLPEVVKVANFLPDQFIVRPSSAPKSVSLPTGHRILVHRTCNLGMGIGDTIFLVVGSDDALDKPYALYHHYEPGLQLHYGNYVSPLNLAAQEPLLDRKPKTMLKGTEFDVVENFRSICHIQLTEILGEKGIANCMSLLKRIQSQSCMESEIPSFDTKCNASECWYCTELCQMCMKPASFGHSAHTKDGTVLRFCSQSCQTFVSNAQEFLQVWHPSESAPSPQFQARCIESTHKELLCMHMQGMLSAGMYCRINLALCIGDGQSQYPKDKVYVVYHLRTLGEQQVLEFFLGDDLQPEEALPYGVTDTTEEAIARRRSTGEIKNLIFMALLAKGYPSLQALLQKYTQ